MATPPHKIAWKKFGKLTAIEEMKRVDSCRSHYWLCYCDCGKTKEVAKRNLTSGRTRSCGCLPTGKIKHGKSHSKVYVTWQSMMQRCYNSKSQIWNYYGGRGVKVFEPWHRFEKFFEDMGDPPSSKHSIDRKDPLKDYSPENCRWATKLEQGGGRRNNNYISYRGETKIVARWADQFNLPRAVLWQRIYRFGWSLEEALTTPVKSYQ